MFVRNDWLNLNGEWQFETDNALSGIEREYYKRDSLNGKIIVPFCPESELSGVGNKDFMNSVWYLKKVTVPKEYANKHILLRFGAVDYQTTVYINGQMVGKHLGGYTPFSFDITEYVENGEFTVTVCAEDDLRDGKQCTGKQSKKYYSNGCDYTRTTGIWQTVWLEFTEDIRINNSKITPFAADCRALFEVTFNDAAVGCDISAEVTYNGKPVGSFFGKAGGHSVTFPIELSEKHLWEVGHGRLYDVTLKVIRDGKTIDTVGTYFGLRDVRLTDKAIEINGKAVYGRFVLDQGFYPDGIYTAKTADELKADIEYGIKLGFNGARMHQKVFEPIYIYWADKLGYMVWGEYANWGLDVGDVNKGIFMVDEWIEAVERDYSHPSIIGWCPFNETWNVFGKAQKNILLETMYRVTKALDPNRPCIDTSGNYHVITDIFDLHYYNQNGELMESLANLPTRAEVAKEHSKRSNFGIRNKYNGTPLFMSEYGGIKWAVGKDENAWGYGDGPKTEEEFIERYKALTLPLIRSEHFIAFCYTQLFDVEQEQNGLMTYDRKFKFDPEIFAEINRTKSPIED